MRIYVTQVGVTRNYAGYPDRAFQDWPMAYYGDENYVRLRPLAIRDDRRLTVSTSYRRRCCSHLASYAWRKSRRRDFHRSLRELPDR